MNKDHFVYNMTYVKGGVFECEGCKCEHVCEWDVYKVDYGFSRSSDRFSYRFYVNDEFEWEFDDLDEVDLWVSMVYQNTVRGCDKFEQES